jgi:Arc/MetJ family transcription regulator
VPESAVAYYRVSLGNRVSVEVDDNFRDDTMRRLLHLVAAC